MDITSSSSISSSYSSSDNYTETFDITSLPTSAAVVFLQPAANGANEITKLNVNVPSDSSNQIYIVINWPQNSYKFDSGYLKINNSFPAKRVINNFYNLTSDLSSSDITSNAISIDSGHGINFGTILAPHNNVVLNSDTSTEVNVATGGILALNCDTLAPSSQFDTSNFPKLDVIPTINSIEFKGNDTTSSDRTVSTSGGDPAILTGATYDESVTTNVNVNGPLNGYNLFESLDGGSSQQVISSGGDLKLTSAPNLTFKKVSAAAVYKGESVPLAKSDNFSQKDTAGSLSVADFRGYQKNYRGWVVSAQATTFTDGNTTISPAITLHFKQTLLNKRIAPVKISSKIAVPVAESSVTPTKGAGIANLVSSISTTLDFKGLSAKELAHFEPGTYHGLIIWSLNNTASAN